MHEHVEDACKILEALDLPPEQTNERAALTLLGLVDLTPDKPWSAVSDPLIGITPIMSWMAKHYLERAYAPNTRETVRRFTMHQFIAAGIAVANPDQPDRPPNSPRFCYQVPTELLEVLRTWGTGDWAEALAAWMLEVPGLRTRWAAEREMSMIPVTLPDGADVSLSGGGQNVLIAEVLREFCARFTPGGEVLYLGDAGDKFIVDRREVLRGMGIEIGDHGKMPDVVVWLEARNWIVLIEAVTSHGPIDSLRKTDLEQLFGGSADLLFITSFPDMSTFNRYADDIAWETDVWIAANPSHLIHFNGDKFLGPGVVT